MRIKSDIKLLEAVKEANLSILFCSYLYLSPLIIEAVKISYLGHSIFFVPSPNSTTQPYRHN